MPKIQMEKHEMMRSLFTKIPEKKNMQNYLTEFNHDLAATDKPITSFNETSDIMRRPFTEDQLNRAMQITEDFVALTEQGHVPQTIMQCPECGYRCPKLPGKELRICPRCRTEMANKMLLKNILYRIHYYWKELRYSLGI